MFSITVVDGSLVFAFFSLLFQTIGGRGQFLSSIFVSLSFKSKLVCCGDVFCFSFFLLADKVLSLFSKILDEILEINLSLDFILFIISNWLLNRTTEFTNLWLNISESFRRESWCKGNKSSNRVGGSHLVKFKEDGLVIFFWCNSS